MKHLNEGWRETQVCPECHIPFWQIVTVRKNKPKLIKGEVINYVADISNAFGTHSQFPSLEKRVLQLLHICHISFWRNGESSQVGKQDTPNSLFRRKIQSYHNRLSFSAADALDDEEPVTPLFTCSTISRYNRGLRERQALLHLPQTLQSHSLKVSELLGFIIGLSKYAYGKTKN